MEPHMEISFWFGKGNIPNEKNRLPPLEVHFGVGGCSRTDSAERAGQEHKGFWDPYSGGGGEAYLSF